MIDVVLPALDEAAALPGLLARMPAGYRPIVVDNGSTDGTAAVARDHGAVVIEETHAGLRRRLLRRAVRRHGPRSCASWTPTAPSTPATWSSWPAPWWRAGPTSCSAPAGRSAAPGRPTPGAANWALAAEVRRRTGTAMSDLGPMRAARRPPLLALGIADRRSGWPLEMVLRAARAGWRIDEVPVPYAPRIGRSKVTGTVRGTVQAVRDMRRVLAS